MGILCSVFTIYLGMTRQELQFVSVGYYFFRINLINVCKFPKSMIWMKVLTVSCGGVGFECGASLTTLQLSFD